MLKKLFGIFLGVCIGFFGYFFCNLYANQEKLLFKSKPLKENHPFISEHSFEEIFLSNQQHTSIHALLYKTSSPKPKGVIVYFHGRGGNLASGWGDVSTDFLTRSYDVLIMDYRGFGKSHGPLSEQALFSDATLVYDYACTRYGEDHIVLYGRSLGTGIATYIASQHHAPLLILEAPYFSMRDLVCIKFPLIPKQLLEWLLKYPLRTDQWIKEVSSHIEIFHGTSDQLIPYKNSERLHQLVASKNPRAHLTVIIGGSHDNLSFHSEYQKRLDLLLENIKKS